MKNNRIIAIILTLCLLFGSLSVCASAEELPENKNAAVEAFFMGEYIDAGGLMYTGIYTVVGRQFDVNIRVKGIESIKEFVFEIDYNKDTVSLAMFRLNYRSDDINYMPMFEQLADTDETLKLRVYDDRGLADTGLFSVGFRFQTDKKGDLDFNVRVLKLVDGDGNEYEPEVHLEIPSATYLSTEIPEALPDFDISLSFGHSDYIKTELAYRMTVSEFVSKLKNAEKCETVITTADGKILAGDDYIPTGAKLRVTFDKMPVFASTFILIGDVTYDAKITAADARRVLRFAAGLERYRGDLVLRYAANTAGNTDEITAADAREIIRCSAGIGRSYTDWYDYHCVLEKNDNFLINDNL